MKTAFFRNVKDYNTLLDKTTNCGGIFAEYQIIQTVKLEEKIFDDFCNNFMKNYGFLNQYIDKAVIENGIWFGVGVECRNRVILVVMEGYHYPRFVSLLK